MKAMIPDGQRSVRLADVAEPVPGPDEAVIKVEAFSVNRGETVLLGKPRDNWRPGKDIAGTVIAAAADGSGPALGSRVVGHPAAGGWAERVAVDTASLAELADDTSPNGVSPKAASSESTSSETASSETASSESTSSESTSSGAAIDAATGAALPLAGLTALRLLRLTGYPAGRRLLITGASGGVGHYLTELAVAAGAEVTAVSATPERGARLRELGATTVTSIEDARGWFDVAMESTGGNNLAAVRRKVRPDGLVIWFGQATGEPVTLDFFDWVADTTGARIVQFDYMRSDRSTGDDLTTLIRLVSQGRLHPELGAVRPWHETPQVIDDIRGRRLRGNAVLTVS